MRYKGGIDLGEFYIFPITVGILVFGFLILGTK